MKRIDSLKYDELKELERDYNNGKKIIYSIDDVDEMIAQIELVQFWEE